MIKNYFVLMSLAVCAFFNNSCANVKKNEGQVKVQDLCEQVFYNAFSHNDYWRSKPLFDALSHCFNCVEADLWLIDGQLFVAHDRREIKQSDTFEDMYLKPLADRIKNNGGKVYTCSNKPFLLMVDCKTKGEEMYPVLKEIMEPYKELFCSINEGNYKEGAVLFFLSGDRPLKSLPLETSRFVFLDGRINDLNKEISSDIMPVVSDNYKNYFTWNGEGEMPEQELQKMREYVSQVHKEGKLIRWWGAPETKTFVQFLISEGVDLIGTDHIEPLYNILQENK